MKLLIDTHIFLWSLSAPSKLRAEHKSALKRLSNIIHVSSISIAEIMIKASIGKLEFDFDAIEMVEKSGFELLDFSGKDALHLKDLPFHHRDPFDRMLIAQGIENNMTILTDDPKFSNYDCRII